MSYRIFLAAFLLVATPAFAQAQETYRVYLGTYTGDVSLTLVRFPIHIAIAGRETPSKSAICFCVIPSARKNFFRPWDDDAKRSQPETIMPPEILSHWSKIPGQDGIAEVGIAEFGIAEFGTAEFGMAEVGTAEVGTAEVKPIVGVLLTPGGDCLSPDYS